VGFLIEPGFYFEGSGYNLKAEIKYYQIPFFGIPDNYYIGLAWFHKSHNYSPGEICYTDSTQTTIADNRTKVFVIKNVTTYDLIIGSFTPISGKHLFLDWYVGGGIRIKNITGISWNAYNLVEDNLGTSGLEPGFYKIPDLTAGISVGLNFYHSQPIVP
jgi:hypothetical protein